VQGRVEEVEFNASRNLSNISINLTIDGVWRSDVNEIS